MTTLPESNLGAGSRRARIAAWQAEGFDPHNCPIRSILDQITAKWTVLILLEVQEEPKRFNMLLRSLPDISRRMLTQGLRDLERNGLLRRTVFDTRPPGVEYALTELGRALMTPLLALVDWVAANRESVYDSRRRFDEE
ncbi:helix-turn-helix domain-containing protein [Nitrospirillum sp. BR 11752]|uniref:winged helix-turn-helix transcriptional regulator n=1 Tax=Nitrospirillum sp. BR 11752 TaxID=3104293 RepID=UPI002EB54BC3|nr:helix-turn-helix domain-containing protein [Nitrospirillum sp. BR 11752]